MSEFELDVSRWVDARKARNREFMVALAEALLKYLREHTPVLTGRLRSSWGTSVALDRWEVGQPLVISSNVEYAARIEYGFVGEDSLGRHYHQVGVGMVTQTVHAAPEIAKQVAAELNR